MFAQKVRCTAADDHTPAFAGGPIHNTATHFDHAIGIKEFLAGVRHGAFITASPEDLGKSMKGAIYFFLAPFDGRTIDIGELGDLFGKGLVPELPAETVGEFFGDFASAAAKLPFHGNYAL